jgi:hypothetical protein
VRRLALRRRFEGFDAGRTHHFELLVFQESGLAERVDEMLFEIADLDFARDAHQIRAEIQAGLLAIKASHALYQLGRDEKQSIGKFQRVANEQPGMLGIGGRDEIETQTQAGKWIWHKTTIAWVALASALPASSMHRRFDVAGIVS